ncbi:hypothetical protein FAZ19_07200 [Sphingobacterium alkalisoli]|uniref:NERD domain-containing protein n=1 Tax=Sphingobacterium alkalisoli TaxID=1874115 RepID=A0A4U0H507_9SPHI|nr:hypothetical protein [Sphingobacterium alkalisoli]TJY66698.1 hypothetical protein FAZ19_07200 [Sphingobacterium alkalisoli]GGH14754.1 hypothetical protein GCM10011418_15920 [Sphingobacterium alkalisoli]
MENKSKGDVGEDYVNQLAFRSYLKYWCYPNPKDITGDNKEICDLLIAFRDTLILISVKNHSFDGNYERYKKKVIQKSTKQLNGAERKLFKSNRDVYVKHPDREAELFDPKKYSKVYKLTINVGEQFEHYELSDSESSKGFISILNKETFEAIINELDTIKDFVEYLDEREKLLFSDRTVLIKCTERDLLAVFLTNGREFPNDYTSSQYKEITLSLEGAWESYDKSNPALTKRRANKASYYIDNLVQNDILKLSDGETLARELMNLSRTERRMMANTLFDLVNKYQDQNGVLARRYSVYNGIGHLIIYYPSEEDESKIDWILKKALEIYAYKTNYREKEIILLAATRGLKNPKFGMFVGNPDAPEEAKRTIEELTAKFGWFEDMKVIYHIEKEYPDEQD